MTRFKLFFEFVAVLCLFLAIGADWNTWEGKRMPQQTMIDHFDVIRMDGSGSVPKHIADRAVDQAIQRIQGNPDRNLTTKVVTVQVMGERYKVKNLKHDGPASWSRRTYEKPKEFKQTKKAAQVQEIVTAYCDYYRMCKGEMPESVYLTRDQFAALGADPGDRLYVGVPASPSKMVTLLDAGGAA